MELLYNPEQMSEEELRATFVARESLLDDLLSIIEHQPEGPGVQHVLLIGPRGMGKTTLMLMLRLQLRDRGLADRWQPVKFSEESYGIADLADLWCETLDRLAADTEDAALLERTDTLKKSTASGEEIAAAGFALLQDWSHQSGKRLLLMIENLDQLFEQLGDDQELARLRDVLMNNGTVMLLGSTTSYFHEASGYEQPFYNFFKLYDLQDLNLDEVQTLLSRRANHDGNSEVEKKLPSETNRLRAMRHFTGGNPRLVLMLYRVITLSGIDEVRVALEKLLDEITPYYQAKTQSLPPQQRKILNLLARMASESRDAPTPGQIAAATRLSPNQLSAQLKHLVEHGYIVPADRQGRNTYYRLSEPLYSVWYQMRFGRGARRRIEWLVTFLRLWYTPDEIQQEGLSLGSRFESLLKQGRTEAAREVLDSGRCLAEAIEQIPGGLRTWDWVVQSPAELRSGVTSQDLAVSVKTEVEEGRNLFDLGRYDDALARLERALQLEPDNAPCWFNKGSTLVRLGRHREALTSYERFLQLKPDNADAWTEKGVALGNLGRPDEALASHERALQLQPHNPGAWLSKGITLGRLGRYDEALASFEHGLQLLPDDAIAWFNKGIVLARLGRHDEALAGFERVLQLQPDDAKAWFNKGLTLSSLGRHDEALASFEHGLQLQPELASAWNVRGAMLSSLGRHREALTSYERALRLQPDQARAWAHKGFLLEDLGRYDEALASFERASQLESNVASVLVDKGFLLQKLGRLHEALVSYEQALDLEPGDARAWLHKGILLSRLGRHKEALLIYEKAAHLQPDSASVFLIKGTALCILGRYDEALIELQSALELLRSLSASPQLISRASALVMRVRLRLGQLDDVKREWKSLVDAERILDEGERQEVILDPLREVAQQGHFGLARQLASESGLEDFFFPLIQALDYATTRDRALIENLPPELRSLVEEIAASLPAVKPTKSDETGPPKAKKRKKRSSSRTRKKLS